MTYSEARIRDKAWRLVKGTVNGQQAWSNGYMMEIGTDNPFKRLKSVKWSDTAPDFQPLVDEAYEGHRSEVVEFREVQDHPDWIDLVSPEGFQTIDKNYWAYFQARYPDARWLFRSPSSPVIVHSDDRMVGLVMPVYTGRG